MYPGSLSVRGDSLGDSNSAFAVFRGGNSPEDQTASIAQDGSASFAGNDGIYRRRLQHHVESQMALQTLQTGQGDIQLLDSRMAVQMQVCWWCHRLMLKNDINGGINGDGASIFSDGRVLEQVIFMQPERYWNSIGSNLFNVKRWWLF